jgi:hypothetical protein
VTRWAAEPLDLLRELRKLKPTVVHFSGRVVGRRKSNGRLENYGGTLWVASTTPPMTPSRVCTSKTPTERHVWFPRPLSNRHSGLQDPRSGSLS